MAPLAWPAALTLTLVAPVLYLLLQPIAGRVEEPLATLAATSQTVIVRLLGAPQGTGADRSIAYRLKLTTPDIGRIVSHARIELLTTGERADLPIRSGEIRVAGTGCTYRVTPGVLFPMNDLLPFVRGSGCVPLTGTATGELEVTVSVAAIARLELLAFRTPRDAPPTYAALLLAPSATPTHVDAIRGRFVDPYPARTARRIQLLNYVWQVSPGVTWIWVIVGIAAVLLFAGNVLFWNHAATAGRSSVVRVGGAACIAAALALFYAVLTPPFQAPDEPAHFIGFNRFMGRLDMYDEATKWSAVMHFERIQFHALERFGPFDMDAPGAFWNEGQAPDPSVRGGGAFTLWRAFAFPFRNLPAPELLLTLRTVNAAMFALVIGCFVAGAQHLTQVQRPHLLVFALLLVPTVPFFAMHVSNHAVLVCTYIAIGLGVVVWFLDGQRSSAAGPIIGAGWAAGLLLSRSAIPLVPLIGAVLVGRLVLGGSDARWSSTLLFWAGASLPALALTLVDAEYLRTLAGFGDTAGAGGLTAAIVRAATQPWVVVLLVAVGAIAERGIASVRTRTAPRARVVAPLVARWTMAGAALAVVGVAIASIFVSLPNLQRIDQVQPPPASDYVRSALVTTLTMFRVSRPDFFTSTSFWGGFGWLETQPDWRLITALVMASAAALVVLLLWIRRTGDAALAARLLLIAGGFALSIAAYAYTLVRLLPADLVGRYVFGAYLAMLLVCWTPLAGLGRTSRAAWRPVVRWIPALACTVVHAYCLTVILRRYF